VDCAAAHPLYGADGLGYGVHVKAGIQYRHRRRVAGLPYSYSQFALHWVLVPELDLTPEVSAPSLPEVPPAASPDLCALALRIGTDTLLQQAAPRVKANPATCARQPIIAAAQDPAATEGIALNDLLAQAPPLDSIARLLDADGSPRACDPRVDIVSGSCSQEVVVAFEPLVQGFLRGDHDLYLELELPGVTLAVYRLDASTGDLTPVMKGESAP
jgi:hypothetical protein